MSLFPRSALLSTAGVRPGATSGVGRGLKSTVAAGIRRVLPFRNPGLGAAMMGLRPALITICPTVAPAVPHTQHTAVCKSEHTNSHVRQDKQSHE